LVPRASNIRSDDARWIPHSQLARNEFRQQRVAQGSERAGSDLDLFVIGTAGYSVVTERLYPIEERLGRRVQVLYFDPTSAQDRKSLGKSSMQSIVSGPKLFVLGDQSKLAALLDGDRGGIVMIKHTE